MYQGILSGHLRIGTITHTYILDIQLLLSYMICPCTSYIGMSSGVSNSDHYENPKIVRGNPFTLIFFAVIGSGMLREYSPHILMHVYVFAHWKPWGAAICSLNFSLDLSSKKPFPPLDAILTPPFCQGSTIALARHGHCAASEAFRWPRPRRVPPQPPPPQQRHRFQHLGTKSKVRNAWKSHKFLSEALSSITFFFESFGLVLANFMEFHDPFDQEISSFTASHWYHGLRVYQ